MDSSLTEQIKTFKDNVATVAERVIFEVFPHKILELQELIDAASSPSSIYSSSFNSKVDLTVHPATTTSSDTPSTKKRKLDENGGEKVDDEVLQRCKIPSGMYTNGQIVRINEDLKTRCEDLANFCDQVKLWVNLTMPKIEDGDNFGVQIQEEALNELHRAQESAYNIRDASRQHHLTRAKICSKMLKYPNLEDYKISLQEQDDKQLYMSRQHLHDLRNIYAVLTDILHKNIAKIRVPKANNRVSLY